MADRILEKTKYFLMKIGYINGHRPFPFSNSFIEFPQFDKTPLELEEDYDISLNVIKLSDIFSGAYEKITWNNTLDFKDGLRISDKVSVTSDARNAVDCLNSFLRDYKKHEDSLNAVRLKDNTTEAECCAVLATHLFSQLVPSGYVTVNKQMLRFEQNECPCGCSKEFNIGYTGIGHKLVWHGFPDLMVEQSSVIINSTRSDEDENSEFNDHDTDSDDDDDDDDDDDVITSSKRKVSAAGPPPKKSKMSSVCLNRDLTTIDFAMQQTSQTITNAFSHRKFTKWKGHFYPTIGCTMDKLMIMLYDPDHDVLLRRNTPIELFSEVPKLVLKSIIELWFILNFGYFDSTVKPGVFEQLEKSGVKSFLKKRKVLCFYEDALVEASMKQFSRDPMKIDINNEIYTQIDIIPK